MARSQANLSLKSLFQSDTFSHRTRAVFHSQSKFRRDTSTPDSDTLIPFKSIDTSPIPIAMLLQKYALYWLEVPICMVYTSHVCHNAFTEVSGSGVFWTALCPFLPPEGYRGNFSLSFQVPSRPKLLQKKTFQNNVLRQLFL